MQDISADGSIMVIGAPAYDGSGLFRAGRVEFHKFNGTAWNKFGDSLQGTNANADFGFAVSIASNGEFGVASAYRDSSGGFGSGKLSIVKQRS